MATYLQSPTLPKNRYFNTLGNLLLNPRAGLLFVDFGSGDLLQLTGATEIVFEGAELASFQGAERLWRLTVEQVVRRRAALDLRFTFGDFLAKLPEDRILGGSRRAPRPRAAAAPDRPRQT